MTGRISATGAAAIFEGSGQMGELMRAIDWARTPVGPVESWPQSLQTALSILLRQRTAVFLFWGPEHVQFYNDAYRPILGTKKHPAAMGQRGAECWPEIWDIIGPLVDSVHRGESTAVEDGLLVIDRSGYLEEGYYTYSFSPIAEEGGAVGGVFCLVYDTTDRVIGERRLHTLRDLASRTIAQDAGEACKSAMTTLAANSWDIPFAAIYLYDDDRKHARLAGVAGAAPGSAIGPRELSFEGSNLPVIAQAAQLGRVLEIPDLSRRLGPLPGGPWPVGAESGIILPLAIPGEPLPVGFVLAGINPRKRLDAGYRTFFELVAGQISTAVAEARAFEQERKRSEALAELDRAKTVFFSNVSHEFRTPLTLMLAPLTDLLDRPGISVEESREELAVAHRNCLRLLKLVNTLLDFSRIEAGRIQAAYEPLDLATLTADLASIFRSAVERAGLRLIVDCGPLPEPVFVDREMWEKIVLNLLSNAFKFTLTGEIEVSLKPAAERVELVVRDTGIGIPAGEIPFVFERFHRVEGARGRSREGSGIGLALVHELTRLHGGNVRVESIEGTGSTFTVSIPLGSAHLPPEKIGAAASQRAPAAGAQPFLEEALRWIPVESGAGSTVESSETDRQPGQGTVASTVEPTERARILVADDNADMRDYLRRLLSPQFEVSLASDGTAALEIVRNQPPDLLLADVMMPGLDGFALLQAVRNDPDLTMIPVILLSARAGEESRVEGLRAGADDYVVKPFSARELLVRISSRLEVARLRREVLNSELGNLRSLIRHAPAALALLSGPQHIFQLANEEYFKVTGRTKEGELIGKPLLEALPEIRGQGLVEILDHVYNTGKPFAASEMHVALASGDDGGLENHYFNFVYQPWHDTEARVRGILVHAVDVSEQVNSRRRLEDNLNEQKRVERKLRRVNDDLEQFAFSASHDLQEPLRGIKIYSELLTERYGRSLSGEALEFLDFVRAGANRMEMLVRDLLAYTQVSKLDDPASDSDAGEALAEALANLKQAIEDSGARIDFDPLPILRVHATHLRQLFQNLIGNAIKYRSPHRAPEIHVGAALAEGSWVISIQDNGIGIEPAYKERIFGLFKRLHSNDEYAGTGIGLAICRRIVDRYHGRIWVESEPGRGSVFRFAIPLPKPYEEAELHSAGGR